MPSIPKSPKTWFGGGKSQEEIESIAKAVAKECVKEFVKAKTNEPANVREQILGTAMPFIVSQDTLTNGQTPADNARVIFFCSNGKKAPLQNVDFYINIFNRWPGQDAFHAEVRYGANMQLLIEGANGNTQPEAVLDLLRISILAAGKNQADNKSPSMNEDTEPIELEGGGRIATSVEVDPGVRKKSDSEPSTPTKAFVRRHSRHGGSKREESKSRESKHAESKNAESKHAEPKHAELKRIEPRRRGTE